jgi:hypothetical protein
MVDPLSIAASIAGLISLTQGLVVPLIRFCGNVRNSSKDLDSLGHDLQSLGGVLLVLKRVVEHLDSQDSAILATTLPQVSLLSLDFAELLLDVDGVPVWMKTLDECATTLNELDELFKKYHAMSDRSKLERFLKAVKFAGKKDDRTSLFDRLHQQLQVFELAVQTLSL